MKAGTTWLYAVLSRHPQLHFAMEKEIHYFYHRFVDNAQLSESRRLQEARRRYLFRFDPETAKVDEIRKNLHWVSAYLDSPVDDFWYRNLFQLQRRQVFACDFSNLNAHLPAETWPRISGNCDKLRVLFTMRDPVKRLWSHTKFHLQVTDNLDKLDTWRPKDFKKFVYLPHIWNNAEYGAVLRRMKQGLAEEERKVIFYEDLHEDQRGCLREIEEFLGISAFRYPQPLLNKRLTESVKRDMPDFFPDLIADDVARIRAEIEAEGFALPEAWG
ncbi:MAG: sulfotransferase [Pseudomonadota bacterium]